MITLEEFVILTNNATSQEEVFEVFLRALGQFGYDRVVYTLATDHPSLNKKAGHGVMRNYPDDWMQYYSEKNYVNEDPVIKQGFISSSVYTWDDLIKSKQLSKIEKRVMDESREAKLLDGAAVSIHGENLEKAGVGFASSSGGVDADKNTMSIIRMLTNQFHVAYSEFDRKKIAGKTEYIYLTPREREILSWSAEGKSIPVVADILLVSDAAVKFHLQNIYRKLNVTDKTQAVVKALYNGLIKPDFIRNI